MGVTYKMEEVVAGIAMICCELSMVSVNNFAIDEQNSEHELFSVTRCTHCCNGLALRSWISTLRLARDKNEKPLHHARLRLSFAESEKLVDPLFQENGTYSTDPSTKSPRLILPEAMNRYSTTA